MKTASLTLDNTGRQIAHFTAPRLAREWRTMTLMIRIYCRGQHGCGDKLCVDCQQLEDYAAVRLDRCRFGTEKPTCATCPVHCYQKLRRDQVKAVMRYSGPRMLWRHPILSLFHWLDGFRKAPVLN
ncbi:MAG: nitrous oxide-stimulated promoter family protein [Verrucomicrobiota bacterium]